jgi:hypothetical protein
MQATTECGSNEGPAPKHRYRIGGQSVQAIHSDCNTGWETCSQNAQFVQGIILCCREGQDYWLFHGNTSTSSLSDHFTTLLLDGEYLLIGGRNIVYKLTLQDLRVCIFLLFIIIITGIYFFSFFFFSWKFLFFPFGT